MSTAASSCFLEMLPPLDGAHPQGMVQGSGHRVGTVRHRIYHCYIYLRFFHLIVLLDLLSQRQPMSAQGATTRAPTARFPSLEGARPSLEPLFILLFHPCKLGPTMGMSSAQRAPQCPSSRMHQSSSSFHACVLLMTSPPHRYARAHFDILQLHLQFYCAGAQNAWQGSHSKPVHVFVVCVVCVCLLELRAPIVTRCIPPTSRCHSHLMAWNRQRRDNTE